MTRILELIFRSPFRLLAPLVLLPLIGVAVERALTPPTYQSTASLWALHRMVTIGVTGPETNLQAVPADTQIAALTELLQTRAFAQVIARETNVASTLHLDQKTVGSPQRLQAAVFAEISRNVRATSLGYNLYSVAYTNRDPTMAYKVVQAVIQTFAVQSERFSIEEGARLLAYFQSQLLSAQRDLDSATSAESRYIASHRNLNQAALAADPQYTQLQATARQDQATAANIRASIATINDEMVPQGPTSNGIFQVLDPPQQPTLAMSRTKSYLLGGGMGLAIALTAYIAYLIIVIRRDSTVYTARDLQKISPFPVRMQFQNLSVSAANIPNLIQLSLRPEHDGADDAR